ncbi:MAG: hypothetical protein HQM11_03265 [SAR324 cluster bacterium]|nr:hypothetical protein [SAR324 cluster bacterium]
MRHTRFVMGGTGLCLMFLVGACGKTLWKKTGDSCVYESGEEPLRRVVNYNDPALCQRTTPLFYKPKRPVRNSDQDMPYELHKPPEDP